MKNKFLLFFLFAIMSSGVIAQTTIWNPAANDPSDGLWTTEANWTAALPPSDAGKAVFNVPDAINCVVNSVVDVYQIVQGDGNVGGTLVVADGGILTTGAVWSGIGFNNTATLIVESGGAFTFGSHAWIGMNAGALADIQISGTLNVNGMTGLGWAGGTAYVSVFTGGIMNCAQFGDASIKNSSVLDVKGGTVNITGDQVALINAYIASGDIVAYGGGGTLNVEIVGANTVITANADVTAPTVVSTYPADQATGVASVTNIQIEFSEGMNTASVEGAVSITPDITNKAFGWTGNKVTITGDDMASLQAYTVTVGVAALDGNDLALESAFTFTFTTADPDAPPTIATTAPADGAIDVARDADIVVNFSKEMNTANAEAAISSDPALVNPIYIWSNGDKTVKITQDNMSWETAYTVTVAAGAAAADATVTAAATTFGFTVMSQPLTTTVWSPATDGSSDSLWNSASNWSVNEVADGNFKVVFNVPDVPASHLDTPVSIFQLVMGDGAAGDTLIIEDGGELTTGGVWSAIGYNNDAALVVESGGIMTFGEHAWIPLNAGAASVDIYGTVNVTAMTGLGWRGGTATVNIYDGGNMVCAQFNGMDGDASIKDGSIIDIQGGTLTITGTVSSMITDYEAAGRIVAFGGTGLVRILQVDGKTYVTATMQASTDATLSDITIDGGDIAIDPVFDPAVLSYSVVAPSDLTYVMVKGITNDPYAIASGGGVVDLSTGSGTTDIVVTAEDGTTQITYTVDVRLESSDATLNALAVDAGTIDPAFDPTVTDYTLVAPVGTTTVNVVAVANSSEATVTGDDAVDVSSGSGTSSILVTAEDGSTQTYTIAITRDATSVSDLKEMEVKAYYISVQDLIRIENASSVEMLMVIDMTGKIMINSKVRKSETLEIGTSELSKGLYIVKMKLSDNKMQSVKFVK